MLALTRGSRGGVETKPGKLLQRRQIGALLSRLQSKADTDEVRGVEGKRLHPHGIRHSYALELRGRDVGIETISLVLRHSSVEFTWIYLTTLDAGTVGEEIDAVGRESLSPEAEAPETDEADDPLIPAARRVLTARGLSEAEAAAAVADSIKARAILGLEA